jgi:Zn-dependent protease
MDWTFPLYRLFGISVRVHWFYPVLIAINVLQGLLERGTLLMAWYALLMAALLVTTLVHEYGHCFAARAVGGHADQILLWPLGGLAYVGHGGALRDDVKIAFAGPVLHLPLAGICAGILYFRHPWDWNWLNVFAPWYPFPFPEYFWDDLTVGLLKLQIVLFLLNLFVPAYPLDGGRILTNFLMMRYGRDRAAIATTFFSIPIGIAITIWGFLQRDVMFAVLGFWVLYHAWQIRRLAAMGEIDAHPMFAGAPEFDYMPGRETPKRKGWFARWRERRARKAMAREAEKASALRSKVDAVLDKVSREGIESLSPEERRILDEASKRSRGVE